MGKASCLICGRLADHVFCEGCSTEGRNRLHAVQKLLEEYPGLTTIEVCRELSLSLNFLKGLVEAGYLNLDLPKKAEPEERKSSGFHRTKD